MLSLVHDRVRIAQPVLVSVRSTLYLQRVSRPTSFLFGSSIKYVLMGPRPARPRRRPRRCASVC